MTDRHKPILMENRDWRSKCPEQMDMNRLLKEEAETFPKVDGVIVDPRYVEAKRCPVCQADACYKLFVKHGFSYVACERCSHVYVQNQLRDGVLEELYKRSEADKANVSLQMNAHHERYWHLVYEKYFHIMDGEAGGNRNVLDVGCGAGLFLRFLAGRGYRSPEELHGLELNEAAAPLVSRTVAPGNFYDRVIESIDFNKQFGQIYMWGVLEHLTDPLSVLGTCRDILSDDGRLLALIPNYDSLAIKILGVATPTFEPRSHIQFFTRESIRETCRRIGLRVLETFNELPVIDLMYPYVDYSEELAHAITAKEQGYYQVLVLGK
ncbi:MAG: class I SAM-dependent methyltransferase [Desulfovibrionaceae bacterium]